MPQSNTRDQAADTGRTDLARLARLHEFPPYVKAASMDVLSPRSLAPSVCADPVRRAYPCDNRASTWLSAAYFHDKRASFHPKEAARIEERLVQYADYHGIRPDYDQIVARRTHAEKQAQAELPDSSYGFVWTDDATGAKTRRLPLRNAMEDTAAAAWLQQHSASFTLSQRRTIATKVSEKAAQFGAAIGAEGVQFLDRQAGRGVCNREKVAAMLDDRAMLAKEGEFRDHVRQLASSVRGMSSGMLHPAMLCKLAETVEGIDRVLGIVGRYSERIPAPEDVIFEATFTKVAEGLAEHCAVATGSVYRKADFAKVGLDAVRDLFGDEMAKEVSAGLRVDPEKMAEIAATLPRGDALTFDRFLSECGVHPAMRKAANDTRLTEAERLELAQLYR